MWDIGGQESLRSSWQTYYSNTHFVLLVIDSTDKERLHVSKDELAFCYIKIILFITKSLINLNFSFSLALMLQHDDLTKSHILILANKQDVRGCLSAAEISTNLELDRIKTHNWHIQPCCALTGDGLNAGLKWMLTQCGEV